MPLIAVTMLDLAERGIELAGGAGLSDEDIVDLAEQPLRDSIENAFRWMEGLECCEPGVTVIPRELILVQPDQLIAALGKLAQHSSERAGEDPDLDMMEKFVFVASAVAPYAVQNRDDDIRLMRLLASQFAESGQFQRGRDLVEQILLMGQTSLLRQRIAWAAYSDVYHRCRNHVAALVGLACALATDVAVSKADLWQEVYTIHRILRDLGLFDLSRQFLPTMARLIGDLGYDPITDSRVVAADLGLQLAQVRSTSAGELQDLLAKIASACGEALGDRARLVPLAMLLAQAATKVDAAGGEVPLATQEMLSTALGQVGGKFANKIRAISADRPSANQILEMYSEVQRAEYAADVARDYSNLALVARRLLRADHHGAPDPSDATFAVELLADQTLARPSQAAVLTVDWATHYAFELNDLGCDVVFMALDDTGELAMTHVANRDVRWVEQTRHEQSFRQRFEAWSVEYPKRYGTIDRNEGNNNLFYLTMEKLDICFPKAERLVIVAEPLLQRLTANLVVMPPGDEDFNYLAGTRSSIGAVPSLTWLAAARETQRLRKVGYKAWISAELEDELGGASESNASEDFAPQEPAPAKTLDVALTRLSGSFEQFRFTVDTSRRLPTEMKDSALAVVTAHGGLNREGSYLHSIRDDDQLVEAPSALSNALAGAELVILFVCSGGRIDKSPLDNSTTSLAKQLLNRGSQAVIASPWPLNVLVTYNWLEPFLTAWEQGDTVLDATKRANDAVARRLGDAPQYSLAMRAYGNVLLTRADSGAATLGSPVLAH